MEFLKKRSVMFVLSAALAVSLFAVKSYKYGDPSALIGVWEGFYHLNQGYFEKDTVVLRDGGYDGQFFYIIARYLVSDTDSYPKVDSFYFRFHRIGFSVFAALVSMAAGFSEYALSVYISLVFLLLLSGYFVGRMFPEGSPVPYYYLFAPFVLNAALLLVADALFVILMALAVYFVHISGYPEKRGPLVTAVIFTALAVFTREAGVVFAGTFFLAGLWHKNHLQAWLFALPVLAFLGFLYHLHSIPGIFPGTNPLGFTDMIDWPFAGFVKALDFSGGIKGPAITLLLFGYMLVYAATLLNIRDVDTFIFHLPVMAIVLVALIGEEGYWRSFDNLSRMFSVSVLWTLFLKSRYRDYRDFRFLDLNLLFLLLLVVRVITHKPLPFFTGA